MLTQTPDVDPIIADIINAQRDLIVEDAVDEWLLAEQDILTEATTAADKMVDLHIDAGMDDESQYLEDDEEVNALLDEEITEDIEGEDDVFQSSVFRSASGQIVVLVVGLASQLHFGNGEG